MHENIPICYLADASLYQWVYLGPMLASNCTHKHTIFAVFILLYYLKDAFKTLLTARKQELCMVQQPILLGFIATVICPV